MLSILLLLVVVVAVELLVPLPLAAAVVVVAVTERMFPVQPVAVEVPPNLHSQYLPDLILLLLVEVVLVPPEQEQTDKIAFLVRSHQPVEVEVVVLVPP
jgi:hypothetical protein